MRVTPDATFVACTTREEQEQSGPRSRVAPRRGGNGATGAARRRHASLLSGGCSGVWFWPFSPFTELGGVWAVEALSAARSNARGRPPHPASGAWLGLGSDGGWRAGCIVHCLAASGREPGRARPRSACVRLCLRATTASEGGECECDACASARAAHAPCVAARSTQHAQQCTEHGPGRVCACACAARVGGLGCGRSIIGFRYRYSAVWLCGPAGWGERGPPGRPRPI